MAKVKKGDKVKVGKRACKVTSVGANSFSVNCGPPSGKKRRGKRKGRKSRRGLGSLAGRKGGGRSTCGIPSGLLNRLPSAAAEQLKSACLDAQGGVEALLAKVRKGQKAGASKVDQAAMHAAHKLLKDAVDYTKKTKAQEKKVYRDERLARFYAEEASKPKPTKKDPRTIYSRNDPRFDANLAGVKRKGRKSRKSRKGKKRCR